MKESKVQNIAMLFAFLEVFQPWLEPIGLLTLRYGLSLVLIWSMKFTG